MRKSTFWWVDIGKGDEKEWGRREEGKCLTNLSWCEKEHHVVHGQD